MAEFRVFRQLLPFERNPDFESGRMEIHVTCSVQSRVLNLEFLVQDLNRELAISAGGSNDPVLTTHRAVGQRRDRLWEHTCFEAFLAPVSGTSYWEFNFSPLGDWAIYRFDDYRKGMLPEESLVPRKFAWECLDGFLYRLRVEVDLQPILRGDASASWDIGLTSVVQKIKGPVSYWALVHAGEKPDFHLRDSFMWRFSSALGDFS